MRTWPSYLGTEEDTVQTAIGPRLICRWQRRAEAETAAGSDDHPRRRRYVHARPGIGEALCDPETSALLIENVACFNLYWLIG